jgi:DNA mismatch repair protein MutS2
VSFSIGDRVHLPGIGTGTVLDSRGGDRYAVDIKGRVVIANEQDLQPAELKRERSKGSVVAPDTEEPASSASPALDLHGRTVAEAVAAVETFVNDALLSGRREVRIIHGRGGGRVRSAVHGYLRKVTAITSFRVDSRNPGVTIVHFA